MMTVQQKSPPVSGGLFTFMLTIKGEQQQDFDTLANASIVA